MQKNEEFFNRKPRIMDEDQFRQYSVLVPLIETNEGIFLLFEKRADNLNRQPGEISFPGGKLEPGETVLECAVRETVEELLINPEQITVIGPGDVFVSPFNLMLHPFLGVISDYQNTFSTDEVAEIIKVPLEFFRKQQPIQFKNKLINQPTEDFPYEWIPGGENYPWAKGNHDIFFYRYKDQVIWGMTAHIAKSVVKLIDDYNLI